MPLQLCWIIWSSVSWAVKLSCSFSVFSVITFGFDKNHLKREYTVNTMYVQGVLKGTTDSGSTLTTFGFICESVTQSPSCGCFVNNCILFKWSRKHYSRYTTQAFLYAPVMSVWHIHPRGFPGAVNKEHTLFLTWSVCFLAAVEKSKLQN